METEKQMVFLRATFMYALFGKLNLTSEQLFSLYKECIMMAEYFRDVPVQVDARLELADTYMKLSKFDKAIELLNDVLSLLKQIGFMKGTGSAHNKLGICYRSLGQYDKAIKHYEMQLNIAEQTGDRAMEGKANGDLGICHRALGKYNKAISHHEVNLNIAKQTRDKAEEGFAYDRLANCYHSLG